MFPALSALQPIVSFVTSAMATFDENNGTTKRLTGKFGWVMFNKHQETTPSWRSCKWPMANLSFLSLQVFFVLISYFGRHLLSQLGSMFGGKSCYRGSAPSLKENSAGLRKVRFRQHVCGEIVFRLFKLDHVYKQYMQQVLEDREKKYSNILYRIFLTK